MEKWVIKNKKGDFEKLSRELSLLPVTAKLLCNRGIHEKEDAVRFLEAGYDALYPPFEMRGMDTACGLIREAVARGEKLRVVGDYDVDGITATYILEDGLKALGADVSVRIPDRIKDGYGINENIIREAKEDGISLIITCDNGIRAVEEIALANSLGITVVLTDHHDIPENVPDAAVILNPKYAKCRYPYTELCGAVVALKLIEALNCGENEKHSFDTVKKYIEIAATATVCDVVELQDENRLIVRLGLEKFVFDGVDGFPVNAGLKELMRAQKVEPSGMNTYALGFIIGPCLNAAGRLDTALKGLELLKSDENTGAGEALNLMGLNNDRKEITKEATARAVKLIEGTDALKDKVLVLLLEDCHESIAGIVAGRIREKYDRPTIVLTAREEDVKGSARSIENYNITEELEKCSDLLLHFGGHAMAAGMSLEKGNVAALRERLNANCTLTENDLFKKISIDVVMPLNRASQRLCREMKRLAPFGNGNPEPLFAAKNCVLTAARKIGKEGQFLRLSLKDEYETVTDVVYFGDREQFERDIERCYGAESIDDMYHGKAGSIRLSITYVPEINEFRGRESLEYKMKGYLL
ncbi:MAG: single-stranded-DNA-specific exonuclease RecJ [Lachnospiraceae bacterium]|nr:single-stranded-DNA-specific exonuclease RecJ [Lachnospiraceae bacterium]